MAHISTSHFLSGDCVHAGGMLDPVGESGLRLHACIPMCNTHQGCCNDTRIEWNSNIGTKPPYLQSYSKQGHQRIDGSSNKDEDISKRQYASDVVAKLYPSRSVHLSPDSPCHRLSPGSAIPNDTPFKIPFLKSKQYCTGKRTFFSTTPKKNHLTSFAVNERVSLPNCFRNAVWIECTQNICSRFSDDCKGLQIALRHPVELVWYFGVISRLSVRCGPIDSVYSVSSGSMRDDGELSVYLSVVPCSVSPCGYLVPPAFLCSDNSQAINLLKKSVF